MPLQQFNTDTGEIATQLFCNVLVNYFSPIPGYNVHEKHAASAVSVIGFFSPDVGIIDGIKRLQAFKFKLSPNGL